MEPRSKQQAQKSTKAQRVCECCQEATTHERRIPRRDFLTAGAGVVLGTSALGSVLPAGRVWAQVKAATETAAAVSTPESLVAVLYGTLSPKQKEQICFAWDHQD